MDKSNLDEIDWLMELEYRLQSDLETVQKRLFELMQPVGETATRHLTLVVNNG